MFGAAYLYGAVWSFEAWDLSLLLRSFGLSAALVFAWAVRGFGQAALFREAFAQAEASTNAVSPIRDATAPLPRRRASAAGLLSLGGSVMLLPMFLLPGVFFGASTLVLAPLVAAEDRDLASALHRTLRLARKHPLRGVGTLVLFGGVHVLVWLSVLLSCRGGVFLISALFGVDLTTAEVVFSPSNISFLLGSGIFAWLLLEPLWILQRSLLYLDSVLGASGADLRRAWEAIRAGAPHPPTWERANGGGAAGATVATLLAALSLVTLGCPDRAQAQAAEPLANDSARLQLLSYATAMEAMADDVGALIPAVSDLESLGEDGEAPIDGEALRDLLAREGAVSSVVLTGGGEVLFDLRAALPPGVKGIPREVSQARAATLAERIRQAGDFARELAIPAESDPDLLGHSTLGTVDVEVSGLPVRAAETDLRAMLVEELRREGYSLTIRERERRSGPSPFLERLFEWIEEWFEGRQSEESTSSYGSPVRLPTKAVVVSALILFAVLAVVWGWVARRRGGDTDLSSQERPRDAANPSLPDARSRSVDSWRDLAERAALSGDHREAIRSLFLAVLAMLEELREIEYRPSASNGEHLTTFSGASSRRESFALAVLSFEVAWFGGHGAQAVDWERMLRLCAPLLRVGDTAQDADG